MLVSEAGRVGLEKMGRTGIHESLFGDSLLWRRKL